jgi:Ca2+-binding EF-hand superfamily protein
MSKGDINSLIWEADEKLDGTIDWDEFTLNFQRNIHDKSGLEPAGFYNLVQFLIYDQNNNGFVSIDETMKMLYARYGRETMEAKIGVLFGSAAQQEEGKEGGEIAFATYCDAVEQTQMKMFKASELGRSIEAKKKKDKLKK